MSKDTRSSRADLGPSELPWNKRGHCPFTRIRQKPAFYFFSWFGKTTQRAERAMRDFVACFFPQSSISSPESTSVQIPFADFQESRNEVPISTEMHVRTSRDVWSNRIESKPPIEYVGKLDPNERSRLSYQYKSQKPQIQEDRMQVMANMKIDRYPYAGEVPSTSAPTPKLPTNFFELPTRSRLRAVKQFLAGCEYRLNSETSFQANKMRPLSHLMATARMIIYKPEPIKCVEAVFVALYLTAGLLAVDRIPIGFKTQFANQVYQHIVVLVQHDGKYGAFGISRSPNLMSKDLIFDSMSSIVHSFKRAYEEKDHSVLKIQIGLPCVAAIETHTLRMRHLWNLWVLAGKGKDPHRGTITRKAPLDQRGIDISHAKNKTIILHDIPLHKKHHEAKLGPQRLGDDKLTASDTDECENCQHLQRLVPFDKKLGITTVLKSRKFPYTDQDTNIGPKSSSKHCSHHILGSRPTQPWDIESFNSNTGNCESFIEADCEAIKALTQGCVNNSRHNNPSVAGTKKLCKILVHKGLDPTPQRGNCESTQYHMSGANKVKSRGPGPLYNLVVKKSRAG